MIPPRQRKRTSKLSVEKLTGSKAKKRGASRDMHASSYLVYRIVRTFYPRTQTFGGRGEGKERLVHTVLRMRLISTISRENRIFQ